MIVASSHRYAVGDRVVLKTDPARAEGTVVDIIGSRYFVQWDRAGRTWIYPGIELEAI